MGIKPALLTGVMGLIAGFISNYLSPSVIGLDLSNYLGPSVIYTGQIAVT